MLNAHFKPLSTWTGKRTQSRKAAIFKAKYLQTLDLLEYELGRLRAKDIVIEIEDPCAIDGMRNDGSLRISVNPKYTPSKPGVILAFSSDKGPIMIPCDRFEDWQDNLRGIALSLEALRAVDRYGVTQSNEQYRGWTKLPDPNGNGKMSREEALLFLSAIGGVTADALRVSGMVEATCRRMMSAYHPDTTTDETEKARRHEIFVKIGQAQDVVARRKVRPLAIDLFCGLGGWAEGFLSERFLSERLRRDRLRHRSVAKIPFPLAAHIARVFKPA